MQTVPLIDLAAIIAAVLGPMLASIVVMMRYQHRDSVKTRELISDSEKETRELISGSEKETRELISGSEKETRRLISKSEESIREWVSGEFGRLERSVEGARSDIRDLGRGLADARERLARIEGCLGIGLRGPGEAGERDSDAA